MDPGNIATVSGSGGGFADLSSDHRWRCWISSASSPYPQLRQQGTPQQLGTPVERHWADNAYEFYLQDSFRIKPNLTLNFGVRYSLETPPWETTGTQVAPNIDMGKWFNDRAKGMLQGQ